jgi:hypothetical protein
MRGEANQCEGVLLPFFWLLTNCWTLPKKFNFVKSHVGSNDILSNTRAVVDHGQHSKERYEPSADDNINGEHINCVLCRGTAKSQKTISKNPQRHGNRD